MKQQDHIKLLGDWAEGRLRPSVPQNGNGVVKPALPTETIYKPTPDIECHLCDFRQLQVEPGSVAAVITDLPWKKEWVKNIDDFAKWCKIVLKPNGVLATWYGQAHLDKCMEILGEHHLHYQWLFIAPFFGSEPAKGRFIVARYRPALVYSVKEKVRLSRAVDDVTPGIRKEKSWHPHQQSLAGTQYLVEAFTEEGDLVADCCSGGWTTAEACWHTNRRFIGSEIEPKHFVTARKRFEWLFLQP